MQGPLQGLGVAIGSRRDVSTEEIVSLAQLADRLGYASVWIGESWGRDAFTLLTMVACHTTNVRLGTGIVPVYSRTPALLAQTAASLDAISHGRAILGLGTSGKLVIEQWHGEKFDRPLQRTREYIEIIRLASGWRACQLRRPFLPSPTLPHGHRTRAGTSAHIRRLSRPEGIWSLPGNWPTAGCPLGWMCSGCLK